MARPLLLKKRSAELRSGGGIGMRRVIWLAVFLILGIAGQAFGQGQEKNLAEDEIDLRMSRRWGFQYPCGYDENTVRTVEGAITSFEIRDNGPVVIGIRGEAGTYEVLAGPGWFWRKQGFSLPLTEGQAIRVRGSVAQGLDDKLFLLAETVDVFSPGRGLESVRVRDKDGGPLWRSQCGPRGHHGEGMRPGRWWR